MFSRIVAAPLSCLALVVALAGCEDEASPTEPTWSPSSIDPTELSPSPTDEPTGPIEPTLPPEAERSTKAGAEAFVEYFWEVVNYAQATGDTAPLRSIQSRTCAACDGGTDWIDEVYAAGGRIVGGDHSIVRSTTVQAPSGPNDWISALKVAATRQQVRGAGRLNEEFPAGTFRATLVVTQDHGQWQVTTWTDD